MKREFVETLPFKKCWNGLGLGDEEQRALENMLLTNPKAGAVIPGTAGARKVRIAFAGKGKSGGARIIYVDFLAYEKVFLLAAYAKGVQVNISEADKKTISTLIGQLKAELEKKERFADDGKRKE